MWNWLKKILSEKPEIDIQKVLAPTDEPDIKVYFEYDDGTEERIPQISAISIVRNPDYLAIVSDRCGAMGTIVIILFGDDIIARRIVNLDNPIKNIKLKASNKYGLIRECQIKDVKFGESRWAASIDDTTPQVEWDFTAVSATPWLTPEG